MAHLLHNLVLNSIFIFLSYRTLSYGQIYITENKEDSLTRSYWKGCVLIKKPLDSNDWEIDTGRNFSLDACYNCSRARDPNRLIRRKGFPQKMYDCTEFCNRKTWCTHAKYSDGITNNTYPLCYQCVNKKTENPRFYRMTQKELCLEDCLKCARGMDLPKSTDCLEECKGIPTFCYPKQLVMHQPVCYQADAFFGCDPVAYTVVTDSNATNILPNTTAVSMSESCTACALEAEDFRTGKECAYACSGIPAWSNNAVPNKTELQFWGCKKIPKVKHGDVFMYDVPPRFLKWFHVNAPGNLYGVENVQRSDSLGGAIAMFIHSPFNMTFLTHPRPKGYEDTKMK